MSERDTLDIEQKILSNFARQVADSPAIGKFLQALGKVCWDCLYSESVGEYYSDTRISTSPPLWFYTAIDTTRHDVSSSL